MIYLGFISFFIIAAFLDLFKNQEKAQKIVFTFLFVLVLFFIGCRYYTGSDFKNYINYFWQAGWKNNEYEVGYKILNIFCKSIFPNYYLVQFIATFAFTLSVFLLYKKFADYVFVCIFLALSIYFRELWMAQVRQSLAIAILLFGTPYLIQKKWIKWTLFVLAASCFHITALVALSFVILTFKFPKQLRIAFCLAGLVFIKYPSLIINILTFCGSLVGGRLGNLVSEYAGNSLWANLPTLTTGTYFIARYFLILAILVFYEPKTDVDVLAVNSLCILQVLIDISVTFFIIERLSSYIGFYAILGYTKLFEIEFVKKDKRFFALVFLLFMAFFTIPFVKARLTNKVSKITGRSVNYGYTPYYNIFFHPEDAKLRKDWFEQDLTEGSDYE